MESEYSLWLCAKNNDSIAFKKLFETYYPLLCSFLLQYTLDKADSEEIAQNVFVRLWLKRSEIEINSSFKSYIYKSGYYEYINRLRKEKLDNRLIDDLKYKIIISELDNNDDILQEKVDKINSIIKTLPERCREILILSKWDNKKHKEIAELLNISIKTVEAQLRIAFIKIREAFESDDTFETKYNPTKK